VTDKTTSVSLGRARLPLPLARQLMVLPPGLRGRVVAFVVQAHVTGLDLQKLVAASDQLRRLCVLMQLSLRVSGGASVDIQALQESVDLAKGLWP